MATKQWGGSRPVVLITPVYLSAIEFFCTGKYVQVVDKDFVHKNVELCSRLCVS